MLQEERQAPFWTLQSISLAAARSLLIQDPLGRK